MSNKQAVLIFADSDAFAPILFSPSVAWVVDACVTGGISSLCIFADELPDTVSLPDTADVFTGDHAVHHLANWLENHRGDDILILDGSMPLVTPASIADSALHCTNGGDLLSRMQSLELKAHTAADFLRALTPNTYSTIRTDSSRARNEITTQLRQRILSDLLNQGVEIPCFDGILIGRNVSVGAGTTILPGTILRKNVTIGEQCTIGPNTLIEDSAIGEGTTLNAVQCYRSTIGNHVTVGPFCHIRPNSVIHDGVHIGDFVEVKNSDIGAHTHISHLTYVGDSDVGERVNFGCGVATANYDGKKKYRCKIGNHAFIGCNTNLVAPVTIGENGYTAAGSTITDDVPDEALAIARARQQNKPFYNKKIR